MFALIVTIAIVGLQSEATAQDWRQWRGPNGDNHAVKGANAATQWSDSEGLAWMTPLPGRGHSSPIVVENRIYLTTADESEQTQSLLVRGNDE